MHLHIKPPKQRLPRAMVSAGTIMALIEAVISALIYGVLLYLDQNYHWKEWMGLLIHTVGALLLLWTIWAFIKPFLTFKNYRYDADEEYLKLKSGAINEENELIPMSKVQAVSTSQGPILRRYDLYTVSVITMGSTHTIPALPNEAAHSLRDQIAQFAKIKEVES